MKGNFLPSRKGKHQCNHKEMFERGKFLRISDLFGSHILRSYK